MKIDIDKIKEIILESFRDDFHIIEVADIDVREDIDRDGGRILFVDVLFKGERKDISAKKLAGAVRKIRPVLLENHEEGFPVFSFVAQNELSSRHYESSRFN